MFDFITQHQCWTAGTVTLLLLSATACAARYTVHPGALNTIDSAAYDTLLIAETIIDQARTGYPSPQLNVLIKAYNIARESWLTYRGALATNTLPDTYLTQLNKNLADLTAAIRAFREPANASPTRSASAIAHSQSTGRSLSLRESAANASPTGRSQSVREPANASPTGRSPSLKDAK
jgi:hypothetical protein